MPTFPFNIEEGIRPYLSGKTTEMLHGLQRQYLQRLNHATQNSDLDHLSLFQLIERTHLDSSKALIHHYASQAWNVDFWLQGLTSNSTEPMPALRQAIERDFGSWRVFRETFDASALSMVASGWTWLVRRQNGKMAIINTYNGGSPIFQNMRNPLVKAKTSQDNSFSAMLGLKKAAEEEQTIEVGQIVPVLGLNMWEHAWICDYGLYRDEYVNNFWKCVNWNRVAVILNIY